MNNNDERTIDEKDMTLLREPYLNQSADLTQEINQANNPNVYANHSSQKQISELELASSAEKFPKQPSELTILGDSPFSQQVPHIKGKAGHGDSSDAYQTGKPSDDVANTSANIPFLMDDKK